MLLFTSDIWSPCICCAGGELSHVGWMFCSLPCWSAMCLTWKNMYCRLRAVVCCCDGLLWWHASLFILLGLLSPKFRNPFDTHCRLCDDCHVLGRALPQIFWWKLLQFLLFCWVKAMWVDCVSVCCILHTKPAAGPAIVDLWCLRFESTCNSIFCRHSTAQWVIIVSACH